MSLTLVHTEDLVLYDGSKKRCRCDGVNVIQDYDSGSRLATQTTTENGLIETPLNVDPAKYDSCLVKTGSTFWRNVGVRSAVTWSGDDGRLGVTAIHLERRS